MKYVNMLTLAMVAASVMAFLVADAASATVLCKNNSNTEACSEPYSAGTNIEAQLVGTATLNTSYKTVECKKASGSTSLTSAGGSNSTPVVAEGSLTYSGCNCEVVALKTGTGEVHHISGTDNGTVTSSGAEVTVTCSTIFGTVHCIYASEGTDVGRLTGGNPAKEKVTISVPRLATNQICDEEAVLIAEYEVTSPKPLYVAAS